MPEIADRLPPWLGPFFSSCFFGVYGTAKRFKQMLFLGHKRIQLCQDEIASGGHGQTQTILCSNTPAKDLPQEAPQHIPEILSRRRVFEVTSRFFLISFIEGMIYYAVKKAGSVQ